MLRPATSLTLSRSRSRSLSPLLPQEPGECSDEKDRRSAARFLRRRSRLATA